MGIGAAVAIGLGLGAGLLLDAWLHTSPALTFVGFGARSGAAVVLTVRQVRRTL